MAWAWEVADKESKDMGDGVAPRAAMLRDSGVVDAEAPGLVVPREALDEGEDLEDGGAERWVASSFVIQS
jgi:hypothetical protein